MIYKQEVKGKVKPFRFYLINLQISSKRMKRGSPSICLRSEAINATVWAETHDIFEINFFIEYKWKVLFCLL